MPASARGASVARTIRSWGGKLIRRFGLLPAGTPDGLGDDAQLLGRTLTQQVVVYFADTVEGMYQLRQWYGPLRELDRRLGVLVIASDSRVARVIREESDLEVVTVARYATLDDLFSRGAVRLALYVNHNPLNFSMLRFSSMAHVSLLHGDSDKVVSVSNQAKAYDLSFVAGQAAIDRMTRYIPYFDGAERCVAIGRPQLDAEAPPAAPADDDRITVLYAPTWEGAQPTAAYGSLDTLGVETARRILADDRLRLVYRPHPLSGVRTPSYGEADAAVRALLESEQRTRPEAGHRISIDEDLTAAFAAAHVLVCDVSAVAMDWLPTRRPLVVTDPRIPGVVTTRTPLLEHVPRVTADDVDRVADLLVTEVADDPRRGEREELVTYYLGDTNPGASMRRFLDACDRAIERHDREVERIRPAGV